MSIMKILEKKGRGKITMLTAYDHIQAALLYESGIDMLLVGDSLGTVVMGYSSTVPVTMDEVVHHLRAVRNGAPKALVTADMPFLSYGAGVDDAVRNAGRLLKEGANAVKLEGGREMAPYIEAMTAVGIPVMGHIGLKPQSVHKSGHRIAGRTEALAAELLEEARAIEKAGVFSIVIEGTTEEAARLVTESVAVPTIGIGAGRYTDGQVLVITDMLGMQKDVNFKHNKAYAELWKAMAAAVRTYREEVESNQFPTEAQVFHMKDE